MKKIPRGIPCLIVVLVLFGYLSSVMGFTNVLNTVMRTAHDLLLNTVFYLMAMCVLTAALSRIFSVFGVVDLLQKILKPVLRPLFNLPGVAALGAGLPEARQRTVTICARVQSDSGAKRSAVTPSVILLRSAQATAS